MGEIKKRRVWEIVGENLSVVSVNHWETIDEGKREWWKKGMGEKKGKMEKRNEEAKRKDLYYKGGDKGRMAGQRKYSKGRQTRKKEGEQGRRK